ncbi:hypothetical protein QE109_01490 [Fusibacter bizertensis]|uniref:Tetratricopeptide repeat protein n=1 Tax=Fusibacter bizertensis TaxID=1488331 RepID=A0ABT6N8Q6_9FIRM|nr:hypothetical protein [Fusibacter bizertensis]MDH8676796.1 hypothetical protein [Fusibacter bizertensis]
MIETKKAVNSWQYSLQFWAIIERVKKTREFIFDDAYTIKKAMISLENNKIDKALSYLEKAKRKAPKSLEVKQLEKLLSVQLQSPLN